jgi:hypothetical protein
VALHGFCHGRTPFSNSLTIWSVMLWWMSRFMVGSPLAFGFSGR